MIQIHLDARPRRVAEANASTREQGRELALAYMWRIRIETGLRRVAEAIAVTGGLHNVGDFKANLTAQCWRDWVATTKSLTNP